MSYMVLIITVTGKIAKQSKSETAERIRVKMQSQSSLMNTSILTPSKNLHLPPGEHC